MPRGVVTHWAKHSLYGFASFNDGVEGILHEDDLPAWARAANARLGMVIECDRIDLGSRKPNCVNVIIVIGQRAGAEGIT